jgi:PEP-CTERM motif
MAFSYSESVSGDLADNPGAAFVFGTGADTVSGNTHFGVSPPGGPHFDGDFDSFAFLIPPGTRLTDISLSFVTTSYNAAHAEADWRLCTGSGTCFSPAEGLLGEADVNLFGVSPTSIAFGGALALSPGSYSVRASGLGIAPIDPSAPQSPTGFASWSTDYQWALSVAPVPEPGTLRLFGLSLVGLLAVARRRTA